MDINDFIINFADQFDDTPVNEFTKDTVFHELDEYSSLIALSIISMVDDEYGVTLSGNEMKAAVTIEDLFNVINAKI